MSLLAKSKGEVTYKDLTGLHKWFLIILVSMGSSIIYTPVYLKNVFYEPLMQGLRCTNADLGALFCPATPSRRSSRICLRASSPTRSACARCPGLVSARPQC